MTGGYAFHVWLAVQIFGSCIAQWPPRSNTNTVAQRDRLPNNQASTQPQQLRRNVESESDRASWSNNPNQQSRQQVNPPTKLIDYPFTVEFVDKNNRSEKDRKLIDYPFTVEFVDRNKESRNTGSGNIRESRAQADINGWRQENKNGWRQATSNNNNGWNNNFDGSSNIPRSGLTAGNCGSSNCRTQTF